MPQRCPACDELVEMPAAVRPSEYLIKSELAALRAEVERLRAENERLRAVIADALEPGMFGDWHSFNDPMMQKTNLKALCDTYGFGAVMHQVEFLWRHWAEGKGLDGSEYTCAAAASCRRAWIAAARAALEGEQ